MASLGLTTPLGEMPNSCAWCCWEPPSPGLGALERKAGEACMASGGAKEMRPWTAGAERSACWGECRVRRRIAGLFCFLLQCNQHYCTSTHF